jgi:hypothetical protein
MHVPIVWHLFRRVESIPNQAALNVHIMVGRLIRMDLCRRFRSSMKDALSKQQRGMLAEQLLSRSTQQATYCSYFYQPKSLENPGREEFLFYIACFHVWYTSIINSSADRISHLPEHHYSYLQEQMDGGATYYARDFPYSFDFLLENLSDMAHIPIAHNALLGNTIIMFIVHPVSAVRSHFISGI